MLGKRAAGGTQMSMGAEWGGGTNVCKAEGKSHTETNISLN